MLGDDAPASDEEVEQVRDQLYEFARAWIDGVTQKAIAVTRAPVPLDEDDRAEIDERAALMEFDGQLHRDDAERQAIALQLARKHGKPR